MANTLVRSLHDLGAAAWFGGGLMGAVGLNGVSKDVSDPQDRARVASLGWARWSPVNAAAIGAHLVGGAGLVLANRDRVAHQSGAGKNFTLKAALTLAAMGTTAYSGALGAKLLKLSPAQAEGGTVPSSSTPSEVAATQQRLRLLQWATPVLVGAVIVLGAQAGEQQRPAQLAEGLVRKSTKRLTGS